MSRRYDVALVSILKPSVSPTLMLICVAKPWMLLLPAPVTPHSLSGLPGLVFSQATGLVTGASQGAATAAGGETTLRPARARTPASRSSPALVRVLVGIRLRPACIVGLIRSRPSDGTGGRP